MSDTLFSRLQPRGLRGLVEHAALELVRALGLAVLAFLGIAVPPRDRRNLRITAQG